MSSSISRRAAAIQTWSNLLLNQVPTSTKEKNTNSSSATMKRRTRKSSSLPKKNDARVLSSNNNNDPDPARANFLRVALKEILAQPGRTGMMTATARSSKFQNQFSTSEEKQQQQQSTEVRLAKAIYELEKRWYFEMNEDERRAFNDENSKFTEIQNDDNNNNDAQNQNSASSSSSSCAPLPLLAFSNGPPATIPRRSAFLCFASSRLGIPLHSEILLQVNSPPASSSSVSSSTVEGSSSSSSTAKNDEQQKEERDEGEEVSSSSREENSEGLTENENRFPGPSYLSDEVRRATMTTTTMNQGKSNVGAVVSGGGGALFTTDMKAAIAKLAQEWNEELSADQRRAVEALAENERRLATSAFNHHFDDLKKLWKPK